jgi:hypothetical protein
MSDVVEMMIKVQRLNKIAVLHNLIRSTLLLQNISLERTPINSKHFIETEAPLPYS